MDLLILFHRVSELRRSAVGVFGSGAKFCPSSLDLLLDRGVYYDPNWQIINLIVMTTPGRLQKAEFSAWVSGIMKRPSDEQTSGSFRERKDEAPEIKWCETQRNTPQ